MANVLTPACPLFLGDRVCQLFWTETAEAFRTSWDKAFDAAKHAVTWGLEQRLLYQVQALGVDEI
jgi:hypothetical protein